MPGEGGDHHRLRAHRRTWLPWVLGGWAGPSSCWSVAGSSDARGDAARGEAQGSSGARTAANARSLDGVSTLPADHPQTAKTRNPANRIVPPNPVLAAIVIGAFTALLYLIEAVDAIAAREPRQPRHPAAHARRARRHPVGAAAARRLVAPVREHPRDRWCSASSPWPTGSGSGSRSPRPSGSPAASASGSPARTASPSARPASRSAGSRSCSSAASSTAASAARGRRRAVPLLGRHAARRPARQPGISWQGHLFGALGGILAAWLVALDDRRAQRQATRREQRRRADRDLRLRRRRADRRARDRRPAARASGCATSATPPTARTARCRSPRSAGTRWPSPTTSWPSGVKLLVMACNTASAACLRDARERYDIPVVEVVVPAVRRAVATTRNGRVGVIGTAGTVRSRAYDDAFAAAPDIERHQRRLPAVRRLRRARHHLRPAGARPRAGLPGAAAAGRRRHASCSAARTTRCSPACCRS